MDRQTLRDWVHRYNADSLAGLSDRHGAGLVLPVANTAMMNLHLVEISATVTPGAHAMPTVDGAGWHQVGDKLHVPGNIMLLRLLPYNPEP